VLQKFKSHHAVSSVAFSPDGRQVIVSSGRIPQLWDAATGAALQTLEGHSETVSLVAFLPDGKVVSGSYDKTLRLWDAATGAVLQTLKGHSDWVGSVVYTPDGQAVDMPLVSKGWIAVGGTNILWLPFDYRSPSYIAVWDRTLALGYLSGRVIIFAFKEGLKLI
jgi:WD40 repeat protein